ncbi:MAG: DUF4320 family protein [Clostridiales bacterium]|nr:DUF4320 family protein [Clostridiales bacterium]
MAALGKIKGLLRDKKGDEAVSFLLTTAMLVLIFLALISSMIYIMQYYNASYLCRRVVRSIEVTGLYDETETMDIISGMSNDNLEDIDVQVDAVYLSGNKIQLRQAFSVTMTASYRIAVLRFGESPIQIVLPIEVKVAGMSEVYHKE